MHNKKMLGLGIIALTMFASCSSMKMEQEMKTVQLKVLAKGPETKTVVNDKGNGDFDVLWSTGDVLGGMQTDTWVYAGDFYRYSYLITSTPLDLGGSTAQFYFSYVHNTKAGYKDNSHFCFVYPASALTLVGGHYFQITLPQAQSFSAGSFDPAADVLVSYPLDSGTSFPTYIEASFSRLGGTARMSIKAPSTTETIQKIIFSTTDNVKIAGSYELNNQTDELSDEMTVGTNAITLTPAETTTFTGDIDVWFRLAEVTLSGNFTVSVVTDQKTYAKTLYLSTLGRSLEFKNSCLTKFSVDMRGVTGVNNARTDVITAAYTGVPNYSYKDWTQPGSRTGAVYSGNSGTQALGMSFRKNNTNSGVVSTVSGGNLKSVTMTVYSDNATYGRTMDVYAKTEPYTSPTDLFATATQGDYIGSVTTPAKETTTETVIIPAGYTYVGIRSNDYTTYVPEIRITWEGTPQPDVFTGAATDIEATSATLSGSYENTTGGIYEAGFYWGTAADNLPGKLTATGGNTTSGTFSCAFSGLSELTDYYYRSYIVWLNTDTNAYQEFLGEVQSFHSGTQDYSAAGWLELPAYTTAGMAGTTTSSLTDLYNATHKAIMNGVMQRNYTILYDPEMWASYWVAYPICKGHLTSGREDTWGIFDPKVPQEKQVNLSKGYGVNEGSNFYARGHQIPNADRNNVVDMQTQTYYPTNMTPQLQNGFNGGIWMDLESAVRTAVHDGDTVYVVTGAAFRKKGGNEDIKIIQPSNSVYTSGNTIDLPVPNYYWKVLLKVKRHGDSINNACAVGFWLPHDDNLRYNTSAYQDYVTSVDQIEAWTGFDFFANLPEALQNYCEDDTDWTAFKNF